MRKYIVIGTLVVIFVSLFLYFDSQSSQENNAKKVTIAVAKTPLSTPFYVAEHLQFFDRQCVVPELIDVVGGNLSFEYLTAKKADYATSSDSVIVYQSGKRDDFATLAAFVQSDNDIKLVSYEGFDFKDQPEDKNVKIGIVKGSASEYFLSLYLAFIGIDITQIVLVASNADELPEKLASKELDAIAVWEPFAYNAIMQLKSKAKVINSKNLYTLTFNLVANKQSLDLNHKQSVCILEALSKATNFITQQPLAAQEIVKEKLNLDNAFIKWIWQDYVFKLSLGQSLLMNLESQAKWRYQNNNAIPQLMSKFVEPRALLAVNPTSVSIRLKGER